MTDHTRQLARSWEVNAAPWTAAVRGGAIASRKLATDAAILDAVRERGSARVLDVGCGEGWLVRALAAEGIETAGVDASAALVEAARGAGGGSFAVRSYAEITERPEVVGEGYDAIVFNFALFEEELVPLLSALRGSLAPGGALIVQTIHPWSDAGRGAYRDGWRTETFDGFAGFSEPMPWYFRTLASWLGVLRESGYRLERLKEPAHPETGEPLSLLMVGEPFSGSDRR